MSWKQSRATFSDPAKEELLFAINDAIDARCLTKLETEAALKGFTPGEVKYLRNCRQDYFSFERLLRAAEIFGVDVPDAFRRAILGAEAA